MGMVDKSGYNGQQKYTICDACTCIVMPVLCHIQQICCVARVPRCRDLVIFLLTTMPTLTTTTDYPLCMHVCGVMMKHA